MPERTSRATKSISRGWPCRSRSLLLLLPWPSSWVLPARTGFALLKEDQMVSISGGGEDGIEPKQNPGAQPVISLAGRWLSVII